MSSDLAVIIINAVYYSFIIILLARILISYIRVDPYNPVIRFLFDITEPILAPVRNVMPQTGMFDFSSFVVLIIAGLLRRVLLSLVL